MVSEKAIYWMAVGVLALAVTNGFVSEYRGWAGRLADKSIAMMEQASEMAAGYANIGKPSRENDDLKRVVRAQVRLARIQGTFARHQAEMARLQVDGIRARVMENGIQAVIACPRQNFAIDVPRPPQIFEDDTF